LLNQKTYISLIYYRKQLIFFINQTLFTLISYQIKANCKPPKQVQSS